MSRIKDFTQLYRIYRQVNQPIKAVLLAWTVSRG
jgi:hypothetical protein